MSGELAALGAAVSWSLATFLFAGVGMQVPAAHLNLFKGILAGALMLLVLAAGTIIGHGTFSLTALAGLQPSLLVLLAVSGAVGIGIGDTFYFACLRRIGPQKGLVLEATAPVMAALLAMVLFAERLSSPAWLGVVLVTLGVVLVVSRAAGGPLHPVRSGGMLFGLGAALCQALGVVLSRMVLAGQVVDPLVSSLVRLAAGLAVLVLWLGFPRRSRTGCRSVAGSLRLLAHSRELAWRLAGAVLLGTFLGIWLQQTALVHAPAGVVQALLGTCPVIGLLLGAVSGQRQPLSAWLGAAVASLGIYVLFR